MTQSASLEANKALYFRVVTLLSENDPGSIDEFLAPGFVDHSLPEASQPGATDLRELYASLVGRLSRPYLSIEDLIAEGDRVVCRVRVRGTSPTGLVIATEVIDIVRVAEGRIAERWSQHSTCRL